MFHYRYQPLPTLTSRLSQLQHQYRVMTKQLDRLKKIEEVTETNGVSLDEQSHEDFKQLVTSSESSQFFDSLPKDSFQSIFWQQQVEAASKKNARSMRWHPLMIRWCLYLRHRWVQCVVWHNYYLICIHNYVQIKWCIRSSLWFWMHKAAITANTARLHTLHKSQHQVFKWG